MRGQHHSLDLRAFDPDLLAMPADRHPHGHALQLGSRMAAHDPDDLRMGASLHLHQLVTTMHSHPTCWDLHPLPDASTPKRIHDVSEADGAHGRIADLQRPARRARPSVITRLVDGVVSCRALNRMLSHAADRNLRARARIPLIWRTIDRASEAIDPRRAPAGRRRHVLHAGGRRRIGRTGHRDSRLAVIDVDRLRVADRDAGGIPGAERQRHRALAVLPGMNCLDDGRARALMPHRRFLTRARAGNSLTVDGRPEAHTSPTASRRRSGVSSRRAPSLRTCHRPSGDTSVGPVVS